MTKKLYKITMRFSEDEIAQAITAIHSADWPEPSTRSELFRQLIRRGIASLLENGAPPETKKPSKEDFDFFKPKQTKELNDPSTESLFNSLKAYVSPNLSSEQQDYLIKMFANTRDKLTRDRILTFNPESSNVREKIQIAIVTLLIRDIYTDEWTPEVKTIFQKLWTSENPPKPIGW